MEVTLSNGSRVRCDDRPFSSGAEGELYFSSDRAYVIKLYFEQDPHRRNTIENIVGKYNLVKDDAARTAYFGWPDGIVVSPKLGIRMPTVKDCKPLDNYVRQAFWKNLPPVERGSWQNRLSITFRMARILRWMHNRGLCHSDLSPKNFLVNVKNGQTTLIDCDGLVVPGIQPPSVLGTPQCMAPEIVTGKATPSVNSDKHALAVLIYWAFFLRHPLQGPKIHDKDPEKDEQLAYGARALYIEHPTDRSNRPDRLPFTSALLTPLVQKLFNNVFIDGLQNPAKRPSAAQWEAALLRMADRIVACQNPACAMKAFAAPDTHGFKCPWCGVPYRSASGLPVLTLYRPGSVRGSYTSDDWSIVGYQGRPICIHHVDTQKSPDPAAPPVICARFDCDNKGQWYLFNESLDDMRALEASGSAIVKRGTRVALTPGMRILLGPEEKCRLAYVQMLRTA
jgi:DNA-binding helix-hairpin-helix protein with protein kinase domain